MKAQNTYVAKAAEAAKSQGWHVVDAEGKTLGRLATAIAKVIIGKHKPTYTPNVDTGDYVVVVNASKIRVTGNRLTEKFYARHSLYNGGFRADILQDLLTRNPEKVIKSAVWGMIPHGRLGRQMIKKLKVYGGVEHPHAAQKPAAMSL
ncbi:MAG: 50S ribosomal protein L13 [Thermoflexales bacterium]|nr:50S ribosomal protein L13 [Thermoflexales bacterium]